jgi:hypothetical protein
MRITWLRGAKVRMVAKGSSVRVGQPEIQQDTSVRSRPRSRLARRLRHVMPRFVRVSERDHRIRSSSTTVGSCSGKPCAELKAFNQPFPFVFCDFGDHAEYTKNWSHFAAGGPSAATGAQRDCRPTRWRTVDLDRPACAWMRRLAVEPARAPGFVGRTVNSFPREGMPDLHQRRGRCSRRRPHLPDVDGACPSISARC